MKKKIFGITVFAVAIIMSSCGSGNKLTNVSTNQARDIVSIWPMKPKEAVNELIAKYGAPDEITNNLVIWNNNGPWKRTIVYKEEVRHDFPMAHTDLLEQFINYKVPVGKYDDLAKYDGSVIVERTKGEISARCDKEEMNFLALNLAHDVATGKRSVEDARSYYARAAKEFKEGKKDPYTQGLKFAVSASNTGDPDLPAKM